jgi:septation ring formation regulator EzrA
MSTPDQEATREEVRKQFGQLMREYIAENAINVLEKRLADFQKIFNAAIHHLQNETNINEERVRLFHERLNNLNKLTVEIETAWKNFEASRDVVAAKIDAEHEKYEALAKNLEKFELQLTQIRNDEARITGLCRSVEAQYLEIAADYEKARLKLDRNEVLLSQLQRTVNAQSKEIDLLNKNKAVTTGKIEKSEISKPKRGRPKKEFHVDVVSNDFESAVRQYLTKVGTASVVEINAATGISKTVLYNVLKKHFVSDGEVYNARWCVPGCKPKKRKNK